MTKKFYRFRRVDSLIGSRKELENGVIYFSDPESLNDPMEGYREIVWKGDKIIWRNLFKHYISCVDVNILSLLLSDPDDESYNFDIPVLNDYLDYESIDQKKHRENIYNTFLDNEHVDALITKISERRTAVDRDELHLYLVAIHQFALDTIFNSYQNNGFIGNYNSLEKPTLIVERFLLDDLFGDIDRIYENEENAKDKIKLVMLLKNSMATQIELMSYLSGVIDSNKKATNRLFTTYPRDYLQDIEKLMYPQWFTACFMTQCTNSSVWGHYGDNHKGICLIYEAKNVDNKNFLTLFTKAGFDSNGPIYDWVNFKLHKIDYIEGFNEVNFFESLGRLTMPALNSNWFTNERKEVSSYASIVNGDISSWRTAYWNSYYSNLTKKTKDWSYENEYRIILDETFSDYSDSKDRTIKYDFSSLKGLIFGIKTKMEDKIEIIKLIIDKCKSVDRKEFQFFQAYYCSEKKEILHYPLSSIDSYLK